MTLMSTLDAEPAVPRRRTALPVALAVAAVVALLAGVGAVAAVRRSAHAAADPLDALFFDWPARGSLRDDKAAIDEALFGWNGGWGPPEITHPHTHVSVLYAESFDIGNFVVFQGINEHGVPSLGYLVVPHVKPVLAWGGLIPALESERLPLPALTTHMTFVIGTNMAGDHATFVVLGKPGVTTVQWADVPHPDDLRPMVVRDSVGVADMMTHGVTRVIVGTADGTIYDGPADAFRYLHADGVDERPPGGTTPMPIQTALEDPDQHQ
jgi:hypothetical protein